MPQTHPVRGRAQVAALAAASLVAACHSPAPSPAAGPADPPVARVGGEMLHMSDVRRAARAKDPGSASLPLDPGSPLYRAALQEVIDQRLLALEAERRKLEKEPAVRRRLAAARDRVLADAALDREVTDGLSEPALHALYDEQNRQARPVQEVEVAQVVSPTQGDAQAVRAQLAAGADLASLAQRRSTDPATRFAGGELGWVVPTSLPGAYGAALAGGAAGDLVGPLATPQGFVVARVEGRRTQPPLPYAVVRPQLVRFLAYARLQALLTRLRQDGEVVVLPPRPPPPHPAPKRASR